MAIIWVREDIGARTGETNDNGDRTKGRRFKVKVTAPVTDATAILAHADIPQDFDPYQEDDGSGIDTEIVVVNRKAQQDENWALWTVDVTYANRFKTARMLVDLSFEAYKEALENDIDGDPIVNSAHRLLLPPQEVDRFMLVATLTRDENFVNPQLFWKYMGTLNATAFTLLGQTFAKHTCLLADIRCNDRQEVLSAHRVSYVIKIRRLWIKEQPIVAGEPVRLPPLLPDGSDGFSATYPITASPWDKVLADVGYHHLVGGQPEPIIEPNGRNTTHPHKLDGAGQKLADQTAEPVWLPPFQIYERKDWATLTLDT